MVLWLWGLSGMGLKSRCKLDGVLDCLPILDALDITFVGVLIGGANGDDSLRPGYLQLELCVVGGRHELGVSRVTDDGMISVAEAHYLER